MPVAAPHVDLSKLDFSRPIAGIEAIRQYIPQRPPFEMLTAIIHIEGAPNHLIVAYKDVTAEEFWVPGHMPGYPLLPGVLMLEAAAQLSGFYTFYTKVVEGELIGLGGIDNARFRRAVKPGDRLVLVGKGLRVKPRQTIFNVQGYVDGELAFDADVMGISLGKTKDLGT